MARTIRLVTGTLVFREVDRFVGRFISHFSGFSVVDPASGLKVEVIASPYFTDADRRWQVDEVIICVIEIQLYPILDDVLSLVARRHNLLESDAKSG